jgi:small conductance mechanosensitive channel
MPLSSLLLAMQSSTDQPSPEQGPPKPLAIYDPAWLTEVLRQLALDWGLKILGAIVVLIITWIIASWLRIAVHRALNRPRIDQTFARFLGNLVRWIALIMGLVICLGVFGVNTTSLAALVGAAGLAIGLALQGSLSNLAAGVMLLLLRPFKVGDFIQIGSVSGTVYEIELFNLKLNGPDFRRIIMPNSQVFGATIENFTHNPRRRVDVLVGVEYAADTVKTRQVLLAAVRSVDGLLQDPAPDVVLNELGASSVNWRVSAWCPPTEWINRRQAVTEAVKKHLEAAGINIPFPQMDVRLYRSSSGESPN